ncbi:MAG TPA: hypothetical protein VME20_11180 [Acidimicrobiales bacterium]|nr:hypothetical protein [Acidimicrobiales bacterium]
MRSGTVLELRQAHGVTNPNLIEALARAHQQDLRRHAKRPLGALSAVGHPSLAESVPASGKVVLLRPVARAGAPRAKVVTVRPGRPKQGATVA